MENDYLETMSEPTKEEKQNKRIYRKLHEKQNKEWCKILKRIQNNKFQIIKSSGQIICIPGKLNK